MRFIISDSLPSPMAGHDGIIGGQSSFLNEIRQCVVMDDSSMFDDPKIADPGKEGDWYRL